MTKNGWPSTDGSASIQRTGGAGKSVSASARISLGLGFALGPEHAALFDPDDEVLPHATGHDRNTEHASGVTSDHDRDVEVLDLATEGAREPLAQLSGLRSRDDVGLAGGRVMPGEGLEKGRGRLDILREVAKQLRAYGGRACRQRERCDASSSTKCGSVYSPAAQEASQLGRALGRCGPAGAKAHSGRLR